MSGLRECDDHGWPCHILTAFGRHEAPDTADHDDSPGRHQAPDDQQQEDQ